MAHELNTSDTPLRQSVKRCPRCSATFFCDVREGCWCESVPLQKETLRSMRMNYIDCLCPGCLKQFENHKN